MLKIIRKENTAVMTFTTFDNKVRKLKLDCWDDEKIFDKINEFLKTGKWADESDDGLGRTLEWGLDLQPNRPHLRTAFHPNGKLCLNDTQMYFYNYLLKMEVAGTLAHECMKDPDFAKDMLKEAAARAKARDEEHIAWQIAHGRKYPNTHDFRDALTRAKNRIRYHQTKYDSGYGDEWKHFIAIIEEFELYTLLELRNTKK